MNTNFSNKECVICHNYYVEDIIGYYRCPQCGLIASGQTAGFGNPIAGMDTLAAQNYKLVANAIAKTMQLDGAKVLDVGCAEAGFTELLNKRGAKAIGIEPDPVAAKDAHDKGDILMVSFEAYSGENKGLDVVVFNDVFEHFQDPRFAIDKACSLIKVGGLVVINLPLSTGFIFKVTRTLARFGLAAPYRRIWGEGLQSPHVYFFNESNLKSLCSQYELSFVETGSLKSLSSDGMYGRVRSTYGPFPSIVISALANTFIVVSRFFSPDVKYLIFTK